MHAVRGSCTMCHLSNHIQIQSRKYVIVAGRNKIQVMDGRKSHWSFQLTESFDKWQLKEQEFDVFILKSTESFYLQIVK